MFSVLMYAWFAFRQEHGSALQQLEQACQSWAPEDRGASKELNDWQHQLRSLVQAGVPMVSVLPVCFDANQRTHIGRA